MRSSKRTVRAITLVEILAVIAIVATLAMLAAPSITAAKRQAQIASDIAKLQKIGVAVGMYREENGPGRGVYGTATQMGLLTLTGVANHRYGLPIEGWQSSCGAMYPTTDARVRMDFAYSADDSPEFAHAARTHEESLALVVNLSCDEFRDQLLNQYVRHRGIALTLGGTLIHRKKQGTPTTPEWWIE